MDNTKTIQFNWNTQSQVGTITLLLKIDVLKKYVLPPVLQAYHKQVHEGHDIGVIIHTYDDLKTFNAVSDEIGEFLATTRAAKLDNEDPYHESHLLCLLVDYVLRSTDEEGRNKLKAVLLKRVTFLQALIKLERPNRSIIRFEGKSNNISYSTGDDTLTKGLFHYVTTQLKVQIKRFDMRLYKLVIKGVSEEELKEAIKLKTDSQISKALVGKLAKSILSYLNNETVSLNNPKRKSESSVTVKQGNFIYQILQKFKIYVPSKRPGRKEDDEYDDAIRKLILRAEITEDK
ncbi:hypothetical protein EOD41_00055 [Mucilaginibacter limnophilus]|uniref:Uncharacterized protein n=1 Tax=Mucilaginibacter limnophilus TaxID=1932778 RepID=A0A437MXM0_9SPHI|nr:hypothetical protein [Mucilaginibacter limnophilus]RVU02369.1 hypothetical protein EOD41_00055 [Mucilaginibacter limnophilus]